MTPIRPAVELATARAGLRYLYTLIVYLAVPAVLARLLWRARRAPVYLRRWPERFGVFRDRPAPDGVWIHAVSVGEAQAAVPLVRRLRATRPNLPITVTTMTPTGSERVRAQFGDDVFHVYVPYDLPGAVRRFLTRVRPRLAVVMETELWPNIFRGCARRDIPVVVANARLSPRSLAGYQRVRPLVARTLRDVTLVAAQSEGEAARFRTLGAPAERVHVTGSVKFDLALPASLIEQGAVLRREWGVERGVWVAGSTHEGEEEAVLDAHAHVRDAVPDALLVLVPRHPERFARVVDNVRRRGWQVVTRSAGAPCTDDTQVVVGDTMGELSLFYAAADAAFIGGSLIPRGGHNPLEAAALGSAVAFGRHTFNFVEITELLIEAGGAERVADAETLGHTIAAWLRDANLRHAVGQNARAVVDRNRGALDALLKLLAGHLGPAAITEEPEIEDDEAEDDTVVKVPSNE